MKKNPYYNNYNRGSLLLSNQYSLIFNSIYCPIVISINLSFWSKNAVYEPSFVPYLTNVPSPLPNFPSSTISFELCASLNVALDTASGFVKNVI